MLIGYNSYCVYTTYTFILYKEVPAGVAVVVLPRSSIFILSHNWHLHTVARHSIIAMQLALKQINLGLVIAVLAVFFCLDSAALPAPPPLY